VTPKSARRPLLGFALAIAALIRTAPARAEQPDVPIVSEGAVKPTIALGGTGRLKTILLQASVLSGIPIGTRVLVLSYDFGAGIISRDGFTGNRLHYDVSGAVTSHISLSRPVVGCQSAAVFWSSGLRVLAAEDYDAHWPVYLDPSFGVSVISEVRRKVCPSRLSWLTAGQRIQLANLSYIALMNMNRTDPREGMGHGFMLTFSL
jgi:hypothetical protein